MECFSPLTEAQDSLSHTHTYTLQPPMLSSLGQLQMSPVEREASHLCLLLGWLGNGTGKPLMPRAPVNHTAHHLSHWGLGISSMSSSGFSHIKKKEKKTLSFSRLCNQYLKYSLYNIKWSYPNKILSFIYLYFHLQYVCMPQERPGRIAVKSNLWLWDLEPFVFSLFCSFQCFLFIL